MFFKAIRSVWRHFTAQGTSASAAQGDKTGPSQQTSDVRNLTNAEAVRSLQDGAVCRGIYYSGVSDKLVQEREMVIDVSESVQFKVAGSVHEIVHHEFNPYEEMPAFLKYLAKHAPATSDLVGLNAWGLQIHRSKLRHTETSTTCKMKSFVSSVHYQGIPTSAIELTLDDVRLKPEVIAALQRLEKTLELAEDESKDHFKDFYEIYGTHINHGTIEFGGTIVSNAYCEDFPEEDRCKYAALVTEASEAAFNLTLSQKKFPDESVNAYEVLSKTSGMCAEDLQNVTVNVTKIGGPQETADMEEWKESMADNKKVWKIINMTSPPKPIWEILVHHQEEFNNYPRLADAMQEEWKIYVHPNAQSTIDLDKMEIEQKGTDTKEVNTQVEEKQVTEKREEMKQKEALREDIQLWIDRFNNLNRQNVDMGIKNLASLRKKYDRISKDWQNEVIYLRDIQTRLIWATKYMTKTADQNQRLQLIAALKHILHPMDEIHTKRFPGIRGITQRLKEDDGDDADDTHPFMMEDIRELADILKNKIEMVDQQEDSKDRSLSILQERLESTMKDQFLSSTTSYEYLLHVSILHLFGLTTDAFLFDHDVSKEDMCNIVQMLKSHLRVIDSQQRNRKQAYILYISLLGMKNRQEVVQFIIDRMPDEVCEELKVACQKTQENMIDFDQLQAAIDHTLHDSQLTSKDLKILVHSLKSQLRFLPPDHQEMSQKVEQEEVQSTDSTSENLLEALGLRKYYPQKLTYEDVITIGSDVHDDVNKKPATLQELPWYFIKHIIGLDSDTRENCHLFKDDLEDDESEEDDEEEKTEDTALDAVHPLDLIYVIFLCADDFLRQELVDKMTKCQYAIPFILPSPDKQESRNTILHWALTSMNRNFYSQNNVVNKTLVDIEAPLIACMNIGEETSLKPRLLNKMLSPQQETFWHEGLKGGDCNQRISKGMAEVAWYLPGIHGDNKFPHPVTFVNVRQNATHSEALCDRLYSSSSVTCLFVEEINPELKAFLKQRTTLDKVILVILHQKDKEKKIREESKQLQLEFELGKHQIIRKVAHDANFTSVYEQLKKSIECMATGHTHCESLSTFVMLAKEVDGMEGDDKKCYFGQMAAKSILEDIDGYNMKKAGSSKSEVLPCQSDLKSRKEIAFLDKELCRQRKLSENMTVQNYAFDIQERKWKLQLNQLQKPMSNSLKYFLHCLFFLDGEQKKYFLQCLKLGLNERSTQQLQPLYDEYEKCRTEDESKERNEKLKEIDEQLTHGSLGIEHFFREIATMYENLTSLKEKDKSDDLNEILDLLATVMAEVLMDGTAIEIMDGDAVNVPVTWLSAVLTKIENSSKSTLFKVAVLGAQSCGKSTLLNTMFGLNFPVSSGRCTRGAYMQLVKVDDSLKKTLNCDYVAVIDSEGLMSRTKTDDSDYDNELSTFIIGLSDLTLVIIKGEGSEMHDVLPLAIHVFLRMNIVGENQACHFVHQNMGAVDAMTKVATEIDAFVRDLNAKTLAAAKDVDQSDQYTKFTDVLQYDPRKDNTYLPGLWDGALPMGKTNSHYSKVTSRLKSEVVSSIVKMQSEKRKRICDFGDFTKRLHELWDAIKYENFVLSFKNVLAVEAHRKLTKVYDEEQWAIKHEVREMIQREENVVENEIKGGNTVHSIKQLIESSEVKLYKCLMLKITEIETNILHYFQCSGCKDCNAEITNRHLLANNEKEFRDEVQFLKRTLEKEIGWSMGKLEVKMKTDKRIHELSTDMDDILMEKVQEAIRTNKAEDLTCEAIDGIFDVLWMEATGDILRNFRHIDRDDAIEATVQATVLSLLGRDAHHYVQVKTSKGSTRQLEKRRVEFCSANEDVCTFGIDVKRHMELRWYKLLSEVKAQDICRLRDEAERIIIATSKYYNGKTAHKGKHFNQGDVELLFKDVMGYIDGIRDEKFKPTPRFKVDLIHHIETLAVAGFTEMHEKYYNNSSPQALLADKKKSYHDLFVIKMGQGDLAASLCETVLKSMILKNIDEQLSCTELLHDLRVHCGEMFRDVKSIQASIMFKLFRANNFSLFQQYITNYTSYVTETMSAESKLHFSSRLKVLARIKLDETSSKIHEAVDKALQSDGEHFVKNFFSKLDSLKISHNAASAYMNLDVPDRKQFATIIQQQLQGRLKESITKTIDSWNVVDKLEKKGLADFLFMEVVGCTGRCPFCKVPCDAHSGGKKHGNHSATLHRPRGLGGFHWHKTNRLVSEDCCAGVASTVRFRKKDGEWHPYKEYYKIYPNWTIHGNANPDVERYWKWVFAQYNAEFARYYSAREADIPSQWHQYKEEDITKDIQENYHVTIYEE